MIKAYFEEINNERLNLIELKYSIGITEDQEKRLNELNRIVSEMMPRVTKKDIDRVNKMSEKLSDMETTISEVNNERI